MILSRMGNKKGIADKIIALFPPHKIWVEPFFGAGGMFFSKPLSKWSIVNDNDSEVFNFWMVCRDRRDEFRHALLEAPLSEELLDYWRANKETDPIMRAVRFIFLSNFTFRRTGVTFQFGPVNYKQLVLDRLDATSERLRYVQFANRDFKDFFAKQVGKSDVDKMFIYCDPPYLETTDTYETSFVYEDTKELFRLCIESGARFAISEFNHPKVLELATDNGLYINTIGERANLGKPSVEVLITSYQAQMSLFD
jgi:DNA adenine methylase